MDVRSDPSRLFSLKWQGIGDEVMFSDELKSKRSSIGWSAALTCAGSEFLDPIYNPLSRSDLGSDRIGSK